MILTFDTAFRAQVEQAVDCLTRHLVDVVGIYLYGSALAGGLKPRSDIDILVAVRQPIVGATRSRLMAELLDISGPVGDVVRRPLEITVVVLDDVIPWRHPARHELQFGEWLRAELSNGQIPPPVVDPDLTILLTSLSQHGVALIGPPPRDLFEPIPRENLQRAVRQTLAQWNDESDWAGDERNIILALARIWYTAATGEIVPKDVAAAWAVDRLPAEHGALMAHARAAYLGEGEDELARHAAAVSALIRHIKSLIA